MCRIALILLVSVMSTGFLSAQNSVVFEKSVLLPGIKSKKFTKDFLTWIEKQTIMEVVANNKTDSIVCKARFAYENTVVYPGSATISRTYAGQTHGFIVCRVMIICKEDHLQVRLSDFEHVPSAKGEFISFGTITTAENPPKHLIMDYDAVWCTGVWQELKKRSEEHATSFFLLFGSEIANSK